MLREMNKSERKEREIIMERVRKEKYKAWKVREEERKNAEEETILDESE